MTLLVEPIDVGTMTDFVREHHYSARMPRITKACMGGFRDGWLVAAVSFGYGTRPADTPRVMFPSTGVRDYLEIGKMCMTAEEGKRKTLSQFLSNATRVVRRQFALKYIFTWADGLWGKVGTIYQASNFLYGGYIWTDVYQIDGEVVHPRQMNGILRENGIASNKVTPRPTFAELCALGWRHLKGKQFRYVRFLCDERERQRLLAESQFDWSTNYPKEPDLAWQKHVGKGKWAQCSQPRFIGAKILAVILFAVLATGTDTHKAVTMWDRIRKWIARNFEPLGSR